MFSASNHCVAPDIDLDPDIDQYQDLDPDLDPDQDLDPDVDPDQNQDLDPDQKQDLDQDHFRFLPLIITLEYRSFQQ